MSGEHARATPSALTQMHEPGPAGDGARRMRRLEEADSLHLLASVSMGRVVFTERAMPAIRPVNHLVEDGHVIIRTHLGAAVMSKMGEVVAYEADSIDPTTHLGWSVVVTGIARQVADADQARRYEQSLRPWVSREMDQVIRIKPEIVNGYALTSDRADNGAATAQVRYSPGATSTDPQV